VSFGSNSETNTRTSHQPPATSHHPPSMGTPSGANEFNRPGSPYHERRRCGFRASSATALLCSHSRAYLGISTSPASLISSSSTRPRKHSTAPAKTQQTLKGLIGPFIFAPAQRSEFWAESAECISAAAECCVTHPLNVIGRVRPLLKRGFELCGNVFARLRRPFIQHFFLWYKHHSRQFTIPSPKSLPQWQILGRRL
jgi:hypothetical protein